MSDQLGLEIVERPLVVHCRRAAYNVLIDRSTKWGNRFTVEQYGRELACRHYTAEFWQRPQPAWFYEIQRELRGLVLGCWCKPKQCHGDWLALVANFDGSYALFEKRYRYFEGP